MTNVPAGHEAHEEKTGGGEEKLGQPYQDENRVATAEVEPVAAQQAKGGKAIMAKLQSARDFCKIVQVQVQVQVQEILSQKVPDQGGRLMRLAPSGAEASLRVDKG